MSQYNRPTGHSGSAPQNRPVYRPSSNPNNGGRKPAANRSNARGGWQIPDDFLRLALIGVALIGLGLLAQYLWPEGFQIRTSGGNSVSASTMVTEIHGSGPVRINELMSSNSGTAVDENGVTSDWIEIMNVGNSDVNLEGYSLGKDENSTNVFTFPDRTLAPGECVLVYADSTTGGSAYHAPFRLSSQGGSLMLFSPSGSAIDSVNFPALSSDTSYARQDQSTWSVSSKPTPGLSNTDESYQTLHTPRTDGGVEITEIVSSNTQYAADENGSYHDYFELHNTTGQAIDLGGWFVSDTADRPMRWRLPDGFILQAGEYRIIYASGLDRSDASYPHTNFGLSSEGESVILADNQGRIVDQVNFSLLKENEAWLKNADGTWVKGTPSPNQANS